MLPRKEILMNKPRRKKQLDIDALTLAAECLKTLAHPHRLQIVQLLLSGENLSVNEIAEHCDLNQPTTSDHLRLMQRCGFLQSERSGRTVFYSVSEPHLADIMSCIQTRFG
jgi:DNA-binding transcriptional ArsR family regulator